MFRFLLRRIASGIAVLLVITYVSFLAQDFAARSQANLVAPVGEVALQAAKDSLHLWRNLPQGELGAYATPTGPWGSMSERLMSQLLGPLLLRSLALLMLAMILGGLFGGAIGLLAALWRRRGASLALILFSIVGISTPSFFLAMLLQFLEVTVYRRTGVSLVPVGGFGWDSHMVLPVLVLAARPIAQVAQLTCARIAGILNEDYVRTARAKGLKALRVMAAHVIPNAATTVLTVMGTSMRFSLSSLPVVEFFFGWPGVGKAMLDMLRTSQRDAATVLIAAMGAVFVTVNILLDLAYRLIDPRLRDAQAELRGEGSWGDWAGALLEGLRDRLSFRRWRARRNQARERLETLEKPPKPPPPSEDGAERSTWRKARWQAGVRAILGNPALLLGLTVCIVLLTLVLVGPALARHEVSSSLAGVTVDGQELLPPVAPSSAYPLGTDAQGRDILSLILVGARRTLSLAFFAVTARLFVGGALGLLAGWFSGSRLDRAIMGLAEAMAGFPSLLLSMLIVYAVGVRQGVTAFVLALAVIGWGEVMQTVRAQVLSIKPMAYIESAVATGLSQGQILTAHVLPNVWPTMMRLAFLEMGGVLMILGELGFLGVFIGGGLAASGDRDIPELVYYDIPEWSVMLANSRVTFRSYPWATLYPALAFFVAILGFTLLGEGFRFLTERLTLSLRSLFNRYTLAASVGLVLGVNLMLQGTGLYAQYAPLASAFDESRAMAGIRHLADGSYNGRLSGTPDAERAAEWIADEFRALGLQGAGESEYGYFQTYPDRLRDLVGVPTLVLKGPAGQAIRAAYGRDFTRLVGPYQIGGTGAGDVVLVTKGLGYQWSTLGIAAGYSVPLGEIERTDKLLLLQSPEDSDEFWRIGNSGMLIMGEEPVSDGRYELLPESAETPRTGPPAVSIAPELVKQLLASNGYTSDELLRRIQQSEEPLYLPTGWRAELSVPAELRVGVEIRNVIASWPGADILMDAEAIVVAAYYDGLGRHPNGSLYPGANDNASGVATMLETIRTLKTQGFRPKRTIIFVAWIGGERHRAVDYGRFLRAHVGFEEAYEIVAGLELEGVGAGSGSQAVVWHATRERLVSVLQSAARQVHTPVTTRGPALHADSTLWPSPHTSIPSVTISWAGSDDTAHTPDDSWENVDPRKIKAVGKMTSLALMVLASDPAY